MAFAGRSPRTGNSELDRYLADLNDELKNLRKQVGSVRVVQEDRNQSRVVISTKDGQASSALSVDDRSSQDQLTRDIEGKGNSITKLKLIEAEELKISKGTMYMGKDVRTYADGQRAWLDSPGAKGRILVDDDPTISPTFAGVSAGTASFGASPDYAAFEADGTLVFNGNATYWRDVDFPIIIRTTGAGIPTLTAINSSVVTAPMWQVNDYNMCEGKEIPHEWKLGTDCTWHVHVITSEDLTLTPRYLKFKIEYVWAEFNTVLSPLVTTTSAELEVPAGTAKYTHLIFNIGTFSQPTAGLATHVWPRLTRIATVGAAAADPWVTMLQMHIECDTLGSRQITTK